MMEADGKTSASSLCPTNFGLIAPSLIAMTTNED